MAAKKIVSIVWTEIIISYIFIQFDEVSEVHNIEEIPNSSSALPSHTTSLQIVNCHMS